MGFGRFRKLFRREPTRQELYLRLTRGLNIERDYPEWIKTWENYGPSLAASEAVFPLSILLMGEMSDDDGRYWNGLAKSRPELRVIYPPGAGPGSRLKDALPHALGIADDFLVILHPSDRLAGSASGRLRAAADAAPDAPLIFADEDQIERSGRRFAPWFKPDFGEDLFLCQNGFGRAVFFRRSALERLSIPEGEDLDAAIYALALEAMLSSGRDPLHCPGILVHVGGDPAVTPKARALYLSGATRRRAVEDFVARRPSLAGARVEGPDPHGFLRLRHPLPAELPLVSIIIPTRDRKDLLELCIKGLDAATNYREQGNHHPRQ